MEIDEEDYLIHYGTLHKSGRYPWGSGQAHETGDERHRSFLGMVDELKRQGMKETEIADAFEMTTTELRAAKSIAKNAQTQADINMAQRLKDKGWSNVAIGERMGKPESTVRTLLAPGKKNRADVLEATSNMLKEHVAQKKYIDIGVGVERHLGISQNKLKTAVAKLQDEGYNVHSVPVEQLGTGKKTTVKVLTGPGVSWGETYKNRNNIEQITDFSEDGGMTFDKILPPMSIKSHRIGVRYAEQGGADADGVIYVRPGVKDVSLGSSSYAQVRVAVDGTHYLKGMAMYKHDLPEGTDLVFNTNKKDTGNKLDAMKQMKDDPDNPFGAQINRQLQTIGPGGKRHVTSAMNIVNEEGDWESWSKTLSSQMLSKQAPKLAKDQLAMAFDNKKAELDEIMKLTNPAVRKKLLESFADDADSSAVDLKAAALPRQRTHVILPVNSMKDTEVYAPNFEDGERVVLIRFPHAGTFEIPQLTVNNRHPEAKKLLGQAKDAIGINSKVAEHLSGADFDGDFVLVIPNNKGKIKTAPALDGLKGFDTRRAYPPYDGMKTMDGGVWNAAKKTVEFPEGKSPSSRVKGTEMGMVSNLITDMTIRGATNSELARAVRHSMVVIDAEKHSLNYRQSAIDNGISQLKAKYQVRLDKKTFGASTLISRASATVKVPVRKGRSEADGGPVDRATGRKVYEPTGASYVDRNGKTVVETMNSKQLAETHDAHTLSSGKRIEEIYADHSNAMKGLANKARKEALAVKSTPYSPAAKEAYAEQVKELDAKLNVALKNSPRERQAQILANATVAQKRDANPGMSQPEIKKLKAQALINARIRTGAEKKKIDITPQEWTAIQAGAISTHRLRQILNNADLDKVKQMATPKTHTGMSSANKNRAVGMLRNGYTQAEVASALGVSVTTLKRSLSEGDTDG